MAQAVGLSVLLHALLLILAYANPSPNQETLTRISFLPDEASAASKQIVSPSEAPEQIPVVPTNLRSDKDTATDVEKIRKGLPTSAPPPSSASTPSKEVKPTKPSPPPKSTLKKETQGNAKGRKGGLAEESITKAN